MKSYKIFEWKRNFDDFKPVSFKDLKINKYWEIYVSLSDFTPILYAYTPNYKQVLLTLHKKDTLNKVLSYPFLYQAQVKYADFVSILSFNEFVNLVESNVPPKFRPVFIFSPGRSGSTLLAKILNKGGLPVLSEPDFFSQFVGPERRPLLCRNNISLAALLTGTKSLYLPASKEIFAIKMRNYHASIGSVLLNGFPLSLSFFLFRNPNDWSKSMLKAFPQTPLKTMLWIYKVNVELLKFAKEYDLPHTVLSYDKLVKEPKGELLKIKQFLKTHLSLEPDVNKALEALKEDAQEGTAISRKSLSQKSFNEALHKEFMQLFNFWKKEEASLLKELGIWEYLDV